MPSMPRRQRQAQPDMQLIDTLQRLYPPVEADTHALWNGCGIGWSAGERPLAQRSRERWSRWSGQTFDEKGLSI